MTEQEALLALNSVSALGSARVRDLIEKYGSALAVLRSNPADLRLTAGIGGKTADAVFAGCKNFDLKKEFALIKKHNVKLITINDADYPPLLKKIYDPPIILYVKGNIIPEDNQAVGIVGARRASYYGMQTASRLGRQLAGRGITVVSGFARGVDTKAHEGALAGKGRTIGVFGCGLDRVYPPENEKLAERITENGALITEFSFGTAPYKQNFPRRNRIISGLCLGVVVIEAGKNSGSLITARLAAEQGREVFSVPGRIDAATSVGTNILIKHGAKPVLELEDILEEINPFLVSPEKEDQAVPETEQPLNKVKLEKEEEKIYKMLTAEGLGFDELTAGAGMSVKEICKILVKLELQGLARRMPGSRYVRR